MGTTRTERVERLRRRANEIRRRDLRMIFEAGMGHIGGDFSATDILTTLYFGILNVYPDRPADPLRDRFILSKGHCAGALYTTLAYAGFIPLDELGTFMQPLSRLNGHPDRKKVPGVETNTGPLGHGLPVGVGAAIGAKIDRATWRVVVLTGDGELQEGSNWEAAMTAGHRGLDNLTVIVDRNRLQQGDSTINTVDLDPLADKWRAFGWAVTEVDGHDYEALLDAFERLPLTDGKPTCIIAHTHKGKGVSFMEDKAAWHHKVPSHEQLRAAMQELEDAV
ncbi:MAG: transketolase [Rhodothermales bacterium]|nr:transketolase [Rhodothermales bacterium]